MPISGNKGEWSEIYTLFRLLGDGKVYAGDAYLNKLELYYPIIDIIRQESKRYDYSPNQPGDTVVIFEDDQEIARIPMQVFFDTSMQLLYKIRGAKGSAFELPETEAFMAKINCSKLKASSSDKADIHIIIHDLRTNMTPNLGFSIKSQLGNASTLLNAGETTNILFHVVDTELSDERIEQINGIDSHNDRIKCIVDEGCGFQYADVMNRTFKNNLLYLDTCMPQFIGQCLVAESLANSTKVKDIVEIVAEHNPFDYSGDNRLSFYEHKMKVLLLDVALGMTPGKEWNGRYDANGGYLVVREDGEIVCYHFYNRNDIEDYLYYNTRFERASRKRYHFGSLFRGEDGNVYMKLNLQIRFIK